MNIAIGGLLRCCISELHKAAPKEKDNAIFTCPYCKESVRFDGKTQIWHWVNPNEEFTLLLTETEWQEKAIQNELVWNQDSKIWIDKLSGKKCFLNVIWNSIHPTYQKRGG